MKWGRKKEPIVQETKSKKRTYLLKVIFTSINDDLYMLNELTNSLIKKSNYEDLVGLGHSVYYKKFEEKEVINQLWKFKKGIFNHWIKGSQVGILISKTHGPEEYRNKINYYEEEILQTCPDIKYVNFAYFPKQSISELKENLQLCLDELILQAIKKNKK